MVVFFLGIRSNLLVGLYLCIMLTLIGFSMCVRYSNKTCIERERQALLNFKQGLVDRQDFLSSWNSDEEEDCCRWRGIGCNDQTGHVVIIDLSPIIRYCPDDMDFNCTYAFTGEIRTSLLHLHYLTHLDLSYNDFSGRIPNFIHSLSKLAYLNLSWNSFHGTIPHQLGNLSTLRSLDLSGNPYLSADNLEWLSRLSSLRVLDMSGVNLMHVVQSIQNLPSLSTLKCQECQLPQTIPSSLSFINSSKSLAVLDLSYNSFSLSIFSWLFNFTSNLVDLGLSATQLNGSIPDSFRDHLSSLAHLDLSENYLEGGIPKSLGTLCNLQSLDLSRNNLIGQPIDLLQNLTGSFPKSFGNLSKLVVLNLGRNQLTGSLPNITSFSSLKELYLDHNQLKGSLPESIEPFSKLAFLNLGWNQLTGSLPNMTNFSTLQELYLDHNQLKGSLPESIGQLSSLRVLDVSSNSLNGVISEAHLWNLSKLEVLALSYNAFALNFSSDWAPPFQLIDLQLSSCKLGPPFPSWLQTQTSLSILDISNSKISDFVPNWFWNTLSPQLQYLNLSFNQISGKVPDLSVKFYSLIAVDLRSNLLYGPIPPFLSYASLVLNLSKNKFSRLTSLIYSMRDSIHTEYLDLSDNHLSGSLPNCWMHWNGLSSLSLENNNLSGVIPSSMGSLYGIRKLHLRNNSFSGKLPSSLTACTELNFLDLGENKFFGNIPAWIGDIASLILLRLRSNEFNGNIPSNICYLVSLQVLDFALNNISGSIPPCLNNFTAMAQKASLANMHWSYDLGIGNLHFEVYDYDNALVVWKGEERNEYHNTLEVLKVIDFSSNRLTGEIPGEVTSLLDLTTLNLSRNNLTGFIPAKIGQLTEIESIDLSRNQLLGKIPTSLADLSFLTFLDLSNNNLSGKIPTSTQLQSFNASQYMENPHLCGPPLINKCPGDDPMQDPPNASDSEDIPEGGEWFGASWSYLGMGLGFAVGFWGVCGTLLLIRSWRHAYFQFLDDTWDWFYVIVVVNMAKLRRKLRS